jgi:hypothetical protein
MRNYREKYLEIILNGGVITLTFDNWEVVEDVKFGETHYPERFDSQMGSATKVSARRPLSMKVVFRLAYPRTIGKLNDLLAYTRDRYTMDVRLWGWRTWPAASPTFVTPAYKQYAMIVEHPADLSWNYQARGEGQNKDIRPEFTFWTTERLTLPEKTDLSGGLILSQDGSPLIVATTADSGIPKPKVSTT